MIFWTVTCFLTFMDFVTPLETYLSCWRVMSVTSGTQDWTKTKKIEIAWDSCYAATPLLFWTGDSRNSGHGILKLDKLGMWKLLGPVRVCQPWCAPRVCRGGTTGTTDVPFCLAISVLAGQMLTLMSAFKLAWDLQLQHSSKKIPKIPYPAS